MAEQLAGEFSTEDILLQQKWKPKSHNNTPVKSSDITSVVTNMLEVCRMNFFFETGWLVWMVYDLPTQHRINRGWKYKWKCNWTVKQSHVKHILVCEWTVGPVFVAFTTSKCRTCPVANGDRHDKYCHLLITQKTSADN